MSPAVAAEKTAIVTGGSRGLGSEIVTRLLADGWSVSTFSRSGSAFVTETAGAYPDRFHWAEADLADPDAVRAFGKDAIRRFGGVDLLINNAGLLEQGLFITMPPKTAEAMVTCNLTSPMALAQVCARTMAARGRGHIINISSINAVRGYRGVAAYSAAKAGLDGLVPGLARELGPAGVRVNSIVPGYFDSDLTKDVTDTNREAILRRTPLGRLGTPGNVADAVAFLISPQAGFITGQTLIIDGGITC